MNGCQSSKLYLGKNIRRGGLMSTGKNITRGSLISTGKKETIYKRRSHKRWKKSLIRTGSITTDRPMNLETDMSYYTYTTYKFYVETYLRLQKFWMHAR